MIRPAPSDESWPQFDNSQTLFPPKGTKKVGRPPTGNSKGASVPRKVWGSKGWSVAFANYLSTIWDLAYWTPKKTIFVVLILF